MLLMETLQNIAVKTNNKNFQSFLFRTHNTEMMSGLYHKLLEAETQSVAALSPKHVFDLIFFTNVS